MTHYISILMPIYNGIEFLEQSLTSIICQTYSNWELIIGINGVPINSNVHLKAIEISDNYKNYNIKVIHYNTNGKSATLNKMILDSKYEFIALLDVDDIWINNKLEYQLPYLDIYDVIGTGCKYFGDTNHYPNIPFGDLKYFDFFNFNPIINSSVIIKRQFAIWDENQLIVEDYDLWLKLFKQNKKFYNIDKILVLHRIHSTSFYNTNININNYIQNLKDKWLKIS